MYDILVSEPGEIRTRKNSVFGYDLLPVNPAINTHAKIDIEKYSIGKLLPQLTGKDCCRNPFLKKRESAGEIFSCKFCEIACNGVLIPPSESDPPVLKFVKPPQYSNLLLPPHSTGNGCFCIFHTWLLPTSTCSYFWNYYNWLNTVIIDF